MGKLSDILKEYSERKPVRFHMPGNKGRIEFFGVPVMSSDITELYFTDNLYNPCADAGLIHELEEKIAACFFPSRDDIHSMISCGGATLCIQAALLSVLRMHDNRSAGSKFLICDRSSHISLINTLSLLDIQPLWIYPREKACKNSFAECVRDYADKYGSAIIGVFVTSPNYYGAMKDISYVANECKKHSLTLITDNSHGSHLAFHGGGELHALNNGADISIDSVHKTLPALTGAALLHTHKRFDKDKILRPSMRMFASTSPSFVILKSIDTMTDYLSERGREEHTNLFENINQFRQEIENIKNTDYVISHSYSSLGNISDPYRITLSVEARKPNTADGSIRSGKFLYDYLCEKNIVCEFFDENTVILITSIFNTKSDFFALSEALREFEGQLRQGILKISTVDYDSVLNRKANDVCACLTLNQALKSPRIRIRTEESAGRISAEAVTVYPPGVPIVLPGEFIDTSLAGYMRRFQEYIDVVD